MCLSTLIAKARRINSKGRWCLSGIGVPRIVSLVHSDQISLDYRTLSIDLQEVGV